MIPKTFVLVERALEEGLRAGWTHGHKHTATPDEEQLWEEIITAQMAALDEIFWFDAPPISTLEA